MLMKVGITSKDVIVASRAHSKHLKFTWMARKDGTW